MGRGRQKAKQTKVARDLKYHVSELDPAALQRELKGTPAYQPPPVKGDGEDDLYAAYVDDDDEEPAGRYAPRSSHG